MEEHQQIKWDKENGFFLRISVFLKNPLNLAFIVIFALGIIVRMKYFFIESMWTDESAYLLYGSRLTSNPLYIFNPIFNNGIYIPYILISIFNIFTSTFIAGRLMALTYSIIGIIFAYLLGKEVKDKYVGLGLALLFTFNHEIFFNSTRTLTDAPATTMFVVVIYFLVKYEKSVRIKHLAYLIIVLMLALITKPQTYLLLPIIVLYYIFKFTLIKEERNKVKIREIVKNKFFYIIVLCSISFMVWKMDWIYSQIIHGSTLYFDFIRILPYMVSWKVITFLFVGIAITLGYRKKEYLSILSWVLIVYGVFLVYSKFVEPRYILPVLPGIFLLAIIGLFESFSYLKIFTNITVPKIVILLLILFVAFPYYQQGTAIAEQKKYTYTGYEEAGRFLKENADNAYSQVFVVSTSPSTLYSGIRFHTEGGTMRSIGDYKDINELMDFINNNSTAKDFYAQISIWEYGDYWAFPITQDVVNKFLTNGFQIVKVVEREVIANNGLQKVPAFIIFKYVKENNISKISNNTSINLNIS